MSVHPVAPGLHRVTVNNANVYLLEHEDGLALIDTGFPQTEDAILDAVRGIGRTADELRHIVLTHGHYDHIGSLAALQAATPAQTWIHTLDASLAETGAGLRPMRAAPGLLGAILFRLYGKAGRTVAPSRIDYRFEDGDLVPVSGGLRVIHAPGHCAGQAALLWESRGVLFVGDVAMNVAGLGPPIGYEDRTLGEASQHRLAGLEFDIACFGHGPPLLGGAAARWRRKWPARAEG